MIVEATPLRSIADGPSLIEIVFPASFFTSLPNMTQAHFKLTKDIKSGSLVPASVGSGDNEQSDMLMVYSCRKVVSVDNN
jgi:hypothetical protein